MRRIASRVRRGGSRYPPCLTSHDMGDRFPRYAVLGCQPLMADRLFAVATANLVNLCPRQLRGVVFLATPDVIPTALNAVPAVVQGCALKEMTGVTAGGDIAGVTNARRIRWSVRQDEGEAVSGIPLAVIADLP